jgi:transposase
MNKRDARFFTPEAQESIRLHAMKAVLGGMKQVEAVRMFGVSGAAIGKWMPAYRRGGFKALQGRPGGRRKGEGRLKGWRAGQVVRAIRDRTPDQLKLPLVLWTQEAVAALVERRLGVRVSLMTIRRWLKRWGFTPQKPVRRAWEQNPKAVERWLKVRYPRIRREALAEGAEIHWGDERRLRSDHRAGTTHGRKGRTLVIPGTGQRWRCNMVATVTNRGTLRFMVFKELFTRDGAEEANGY